MRKALPGSLAGLLAVVGLVAAGSPPPAGSIPPEQIAAPDAAIVDNPHPWNPSTPDGSRWPYVNEPWRASDKRYVPDGQFWLNADVLFWSLKDSRLPPLVTAGSIHSGGVIGRLGTQTLFGDKDDDLGLFTGGRFAGGVWLNDDQTVGFEGGYFSLPERGNELTTTSPTGVGSLAIPFLNARTGKEDALLVSQPGTRSGSVAVDTSTSLQGGAASLVWIVACDPTYRVELLGGFRYLALADNLAVGEDFSLGSGTTHHGERFTVEDRFGGRNHFYGSQLAARAEYHWGQLVLSGLGELDLGDNEEEVRINGGTRVIPAMRTGAGHARGHHVGPAAKVFGAGLFALPSNIGDHHDGQFAVVPQLNFSVGWQLTPHVRLLAGYSFLFWSDVVRAAEQVDRGVNVTRVPALLPIGRPSGPDRPEFSFHSTDFWAQGGNIGVQIDY